MALETQTITDINTEELWSAVLGDLQLQLPEHSYNTWLKGTSITSIDEKTVHVLVKSTFALDWLERRCYQSIEKTLEKITGNKYNVNFVIQATSPSNSISQAKPSLHNNKITSFNSAYTFETFIEGPNNSLALNAAIAVSSKEQNPYNPLFLYSDVGLGKTHLLHAIGNSSNQNGNTVVYTTGEKFTNEFIFSIRDKSTDRFKASYIGTDVLLIDDIQFISGKEQTQEGFFHIFNDLHQNGTKIVISSDQAPNKLNNFQQRLSSRFEWGLIADIQRPSLETRIAIIEHKLASLNLSLEYSTIENIAKHANKNIRQIEGMLNKLSAHVTLMNLSLTPDNITNLLQSYNQQHRSQALTKDIILSNVARYYGIEPNAIQGKQRSALIANARQITMFLLKKELNATTAEIGRFLGDRNHSTVIHGIEKITRTQQSSQDQQTQIKEIRNSLY